MLWRLRREILFAVCVAAALVLLSRGAPARPSGPEPPVAWRLPEHEGELRKENARLRRLLGLREREPRLARALIAEVVRAKPSVYPGELVINKGSAEGVARDMPVLSSDGALVGRVAAVTEQSATVFTLYHPTIRISILVGSSRELGVLKGGTFPLLWLDYVSRERPPGIGEEVLTSGLSDFYPKGVKIGRVRRVGGSREEFFVGVGVQPYLGSAFPEEVLVGH